MRSADRIRLIRIAAALLIVAGFGIGAVLLITSNHSATATNNNAPPGIGPLPTAQSVEPGTTTGATLSVAAGQLAIAVPDPQLAATPVERCDHVDILQLNSSNQVVNTFSNVLVIQTSATNGGSLIVEVSRDLAPSIIVAAAQSSGVRIVATPHSATGSCT